ncbi:hypothetical protein MBLNU459_g4109t1 [Dothideomycetes sp. NU459]
MRNDPQEIYGWRVYALACSACFGGMLFGVDSGIIANKPRTYGLQGLSKVAAADLSANIVSTLQCGCFVGALAASWVADRLGRRPALMIAAVFVMVGVIMQSAALGHLASMYVGRFVAGLGVGAASMVTPLYVSENAPRAIRGGLTGLYQLFIATGTMLAFWQVSRLAIVGDCFWLTNARINYGALLHLKGNTTYIVPLVMQSLPAILLLGSMYFCNESPRWLARQDRWDEASAILSHIRQLPSTHPYVEGELQEMNEQLEHERLLVGGAKFMDLQREMWTIPGNRKRALLTIALMICQQLTGVNAINYYSPQIFESLGLNSTASGLFATGVYGIVKMTTCASFLLFLADSLGRRRSLLWTSIGMGCAMFYVGLYVRILPPVAGTKIPPAGYMALVSVYLFAGIYQCGFGPVPWIFISEIPTARLRSLNVALGAATQWLFNLVIARATPNMLATMGRAGYGAFLTFGSFAFAMFVFVWFCIPETKGLALEKMDDLFGVTELVKKVEADMEAQHTDHPGDDVKGGAEKAQHVEISPVASK